MAFGNRRDFLRLSLASASALALGFGQDEAAAQQASAAAPSLSRFIDPLPIPPRIQPHGRRGDTVLYRARMVEFQKPLHSQLPPARLWGYEGHWPGPTFEAMRGVPAEVHWSSDLPHRHLFPVDTHLDSCRPPVPAVRTVPHLHGSRTPSDSDGLPERWFTPGHSVVFHYPNQQRAATLWYHDHAGGIGRLNRVAGLAGFYLLRDNQELSMNLPSGDSEIPLMLQDRSVDAQGQLVYQPNQDDGSLVPPPLWGPQFFGNLAVVNGAAFPYMEVEPRRYRFRVLNAANSRFFNLYLNLAARPTDIPTLVGFHQIGSDGGLLAAPAKMLHLLLAPAERADLIVDFSGLEGRTVTLSNNAMSPYPGWALFAATHPALEEIMQFRVGGQASAGARGFSLPTPISLPRLRPEQAVRTRTFVLSAETNAKGLSLQMQIDGKTYMDPTTEFPALGSIEQWRFINTTDDSHPMHLHLVQFQIHERQGYDYGSFLLRKELVFKGTPRALAPNEMGWKDTAIVNPGEVLTILVPFLGFTGKYLFHCHLAEHADNNMMRPFVVVGPGDQKETALRS